MRLRSPGRPGTSFYALDVPALEGGGTPHEAESRDVFIIPDLDSCRTAAMLILGVASYL